MSTQRSIFSGEFGEILIPDLLTFLDMLGRTGTLELRRGDVTKRIHWQQGEIVFADSTDPGEQFGEYLLRNGWVSPEALQAARAKAKSDADLVKHLIRDGALRPDLLPKSERSLVLDIVYSIFEWRDGTFTFAVTPKPHDERVVLKTSVSNIIMEGSRRLDEWKRIRETLRSDDAFPHRASGEAPASLQLPPVEQDVLAQVDGRRNVTDIVRAVEHDQFNVLNALLTLHSAGLVTIHDAPAESAPPVAQAGLSDEQRARMAEVLQAYNNIFESLLERVRRIKGDEGAARFASTLQQPTFQRGGAFAGVAFTQQGRVPAGPVLANAAAFPDDERLGKLKGSLDRLLAKQVLMLDTSIPPGEKQAISEIIAREKAKLAEMEIGSA